MSKMRDCPPVKNSCFSPPSSLAGSPQKVTLMVLVGQKYSFQALVKSHHKCFLLTVTLISSSFMFARLPISSLKSPCPRIAPYSINKGDKIIDQGN